MSDLAKNPTEELIEAVKTAYDHFNRDLFKGQLPNVVFNFQRQQRVMGYASIGRWVNERKQYVDELGINPDYFAKYPVIEIFQTLCHEMTHIWQAHYGTPGRRGYHNRQFGNKLTQIGLLPSSTGKPGGRTVGEHMLDYVLADGPFHAASQTLVQQGFRLPWADRYPVFRMDEPFVVYDKSGTAIALDDDFSSVKSMAKRGTTEAALKNERLLHASSPTLMAAVTFPEDADDADQVARLNTTKPRPKSGRHKYLCKGCQAAVWGKPCLRIQCYDCELLFTELD